ncbi:hypothetical protein N9571_05545 [Yoonia sp.]|nr:hypothetical protein [Yoonia sp.]
MSVFALFVAMASSGLAHRFESRAATESLNAYLAAVLTPIFALMTGLAGTAVARPVMRVA